VKFRTTTQFEKEYTRAEKRGMDITKLDAVMQKIINSEPLEQKYRDHSLTGNFKGRRECHIEPDWLLIYKIDKKEQVIVFERTGSHSDLFE
jgi:mRNA interferase YafQ